MIDWQDSRTRTTYLSFFVFFYPFLVFFVNVLYSILIKFESIPLHVPLTTHKLFIHLCHITPRSQWTLKGKLSDHCKNRNENCVCLKERSMFFVFHN